MPCVVETRIRAISEAGRSRRRIHGFHVSDIQSHENLRTEPEKRNPIETYCTVSLHSDVYWSLRLGSMLWLHLHGLSVEDDTSSRPVCLGAANSCDCLLCQYLRRQGVLEWRAGLAISQVDLEACADPLRRHDRCGSGRHQGEDRLPVGLGVLAFGTAALDDYRALRIEYEARPPDEGGNQEASEDISGLST